MAWRVLHITMAARLALDNGALSIVRDGQDELRLAVEDIAFIVIDSPQVSLTARLMAAMAEGGVVVLFTDARHHPCGIYLPYHIHHRQADITAQQASLNPQQKDRLWQIIAAAKIRHQGDCLMTLGRPAEVFSALAEQVRPGDPMNVEARAAREYWRLLFDDFRRDDDADRRNGLLNYGYAILRAAIARSIAIQGLVPALGLHHASQLNPFNLADDLIEPLRPLVDYFAHAYAARDGFDRAASLGLDDRRFMIGLTQAKLILPDGRFDLLDGIDAYIQSLIRAIQSGRARQLTPPMPDFAIPS